MEKSKEVSYEFKTFAPSGIVLDKKRTFKRALRTSIGMDVYAPTKNAMNFNSCDGIVDSKCQSELKNLDSRQ